MRCGTATDDLRRPQVSSCAESAARGRAGNKYLPRHHFNMFMCILLSV